MGQESNIGWTDATNNFWRGCNKVSEGCKYCYMFRWGSQYKKDMTKYIRASDKTFYAPLKWKDSKRIFTCSLSDFFLPDADNDREDAWGVIRDTPHHEWLILTKRPERIESCLPEDWGNGYNNVWLGVTAENQLRLFQRIEFLKEIKAPVKFLSIEPILGEIDLLDPMLSDAMKEIDWVIIGGESGNDNGPHKYRPSELNWYISLVVQCKTLGIPVFVKQLGTHLAKELGFKDRKGETFDLLPKSLQVREFPEKKYKSTQLKIL